MQPETYNLGQLIIDTLPPWAFKYNWFLTQGLQIIIECEHRKLHITPDNLTLDKLNK